MHMTGIAFTHFNFTNSLFSYTYRYTKCLLT